jgi:hypothetical protein
MLPDVLPPMLPDVLPPIVPEVPAAPLDEPLVADVSLLMLPLLEPLVLLPLEPLMLPLPLEPLMLPLLLEPPMLPEPLIPPASLRTRTPEETCAWLVAAAPTVRTTATPIAQLMLDRTLICLSS